MVNGQFVNVVEKLINIDNFMKNGQIFQNLVLNCNNDNFDNIVEIRILIICE